MIMSESDLLGVGGGELLTRKRINNINMNAATASNHQIPPEESEQPPPELLLPLEELLEKKSYGHLPPG